MVENRGTERVVGGALDPDEERIIAYELQGQSHRGWAGNGEQPVHGIYYDDHGDQSTSPSHRYHAAAAASSASGIISLQSWSSMPLPSGS